MKNTKSFESKISRKIKVHLFYFAGEVERLLKEYRQNQELVRRIGGHYYQIIYPVQLRHHEKMGISTREVAKVRNRLRKRNTFNFTVCSIIFTTTITHAPIHQNKFDLRFKDLRKIISKIVRTEI